MSNQQRADELHKPVIGNIWKRTVHSSFKDNIWGANLTHIHVITKYKNRILQKNRFLLCLNDIFRKYYWVVPLKDKNGTITQCI